MRKMISLLTLTTICLIGMMAQSQAQSNDPPTDVVVETTVVATDQCADGKPRTQIEVDALTGVEYTVKNVDTDCVEVINHTYNGKSADDGVPVDATVNPFPAPEKVVGNKYDFGGGFFASGLVLLQPRDDRDGYDEATEELMTAGLVGTINTPSWEWSANVGVGGCGKREVAATAGAALLHKQSKHFGLGPTVNLSFCSDKDHPDEELVQLRVVDAGLRLAGDWEHFGIFADVVGAVTTEPMFIGRSTVPSLGVRLGIRTGWF